MTVEIVLQQFQPSEEQRYRASLAVWRALFASLSFLLPSSPFHGKSISRPLQQRGGGGISFADRGWIGSRRQTPFLVVKEGGLQREFQVRWKGAESADEPPQISRLKLPTKFDPCLSQYRHQRTKLPES